LAGVMFCGGCGFKGGDQSLEEIFDQIYKVGRNAKLSLTNLDGAVRIYGADIDEIHVYAVKRAYSAARLAKIDIHVTTQPGAVSIETIYPPRKKWGLGDRSGTVDYTIVVPFTCAISKVDMETGEILIEGIRGGSAHVHLTNGRLFAHDCFGNIELKIDNGGIDVYYDWWEDQKFSVSATIVDGGVRAFIPIDSSFHLIAEAEEGEIGNDFAEKEQRKPGVHQIDKIIGSPALAEIRLHARNGNVRIAEVTY
jgi:hypothetical protein